MEIRRALGDKAAVLQTDREMVGFDPSRFCVLHNRPEYPRTGVPEDDIFSDLAVPDPEFEDWIRDQRIYLAAHSAGRGHSRPLTSTEMGKPLIVFRLDGDGEARSRLLARELVALATASLLDFADFPIYHDGQVTGPEATAPQAGLLVRLTVSALLDKKVVIVSLEHPASGRTFWARRITGASDEPDEALPLPVSAEVVEAVLTTLRRHREALGIPDAPPCSPRPRRD